MLDYIAKIVVLFVIISRSLPLGEITTSDPVSCPVGFATGMTCTEVTISCPDAAVSTATYGFLDGCNVFKGTIVLFGDGLGNEPFDHGYVDEYIAGGFRVAQASFTSPAWTTTGEGTQNLKVSACRPATLLYHIFANVHYEDVGHGFCAHGHGYGSDAIAYTMAWYNGNNWMDHVMMSNGPFFAEMTSGCVYPTSAPVDVCPGNQNYCGQKCLGFEGDVSYINTIYPCSLSELTGYSCACSTDPSGSEQIDWWDAQKIVGDGAYLLYTNTGVGIWLCSNNDNANSGQGQFYAQSVYSNSGVTEYLVSDCMSSGSVWDGTFAPTSESGLVASAKSLMEHCIPRHA